MSDAVLPHPRPIWPVLLATGVGVALLLALGFWQLQRLHWKNGLVAQIEARSRAAPIAPPPEADWPRLKPEDFEYRHVAVTGVYRPQDALVFRGGAPNAPAGEGPGYLVFTPLALESGGIVLVNRGFAPLAQADQARAKPEGRVEVSGLMRGAETRNPFTPDDQPGRGVWYTRDPAAIGAGLGLARVAPFTIDGDAGPQARGWPRPGATQLDIPNNHLSYALTWWGLAGALLGVAAAFLRRRRAN